ERAARAKLAPSLILREWHGHLVAIDPCRPPEGWTMDRWQTLCDDAYWIYEKYAPRAVRDGWSSADLFGLWPGVPHLGGLADRLKGSRSLVLTADRACWRSW